MVKNKNNILIAGIGGASLGTEIFKSLKLAKRYNIYGADISPYAYGLYEKGFKKTYLVKENNYIDDILQICKKEKIDAIIPGGEKPLELISNNQEYFHKKNILLAINSQRVTSLCTDKIKTFDYLRERNIPVPFTRVINDSADLTNIPYPCVIKPSVGSGGSVFAYILENKEEAKLFLSYFKKRKLKAIIQEYIPIDEGEFTIGVLSFPDGTLAGSIALKRLFSSKLSILMKTENRIISSGYSQGVIDNFDEIKKQAEAITRIINSKGPLNIQGRVKNGVFYPFEINPRFSASTYLRAMAGFNEIDMFLQFLFTHKKSSLPRIKYGYYFRSLEEKFVSFRKIKKYQL